MKTIKIYIFFSILALTLASFVGCKKDAVHNSLTVDNYSLTFQGIGGSISISLNTDAASWTISSKSNWLQLSQTSGNKGRASITVTALLNPGSGSRSDTITLSAGNSSSIQIPVLQKGSLYPNYNASPIAPDASGMSDNATQIAAKIKLGWNIGNTLEAIGIDGETAWGNPLITQAFVDFVKASGFNAIRLPCSWNQHSNSATALIDPIWLARVKQVVQYCVNDNMYVLLNIHWDGGWLENNCTEAKQDSVNAKQLAFWQQIATCLRDFDEHLLFASANEPSVSDATGMSVLNSYHQTFINAVRSTGGRNSYRVLVVQGPSTDITLTSQLMMLPIDTIPSHMMVEVHYYTPYNFCGLTSDAAWGNMFYYWGKDYHSTTDITRNATCCEEGTVDTNMKLMNTLFVNNKIPVILGEFTAVRRTNLTGDSLTLHLASRAHFIKYVTQQAKANGILPFFWDTGGVLDRNNCTVLDQQALDALIQGYAK